MHGYTNKQRGQVLSVEEYERVQRLHHLSRRADEHCHAIVQGSVRLYVVCMYACTHTYMHTYTHSKAMCVCAWCVVLYVCVHIHAWIHTYLVVCIL